MPTSIGSTPVRADSDAILVGAATVRNDNLRLDGRDYMVAAQMLSALGLDRVTLLANNPDKAAQLERLGVTVVARMPTAVDINATNARYLATKARRGAHTLDLPRAERLDAEA